MNLIPNTATAAEKLRRLAKKQRKLSGTSLGVALDEVARANGYLNWKHVTVCASQKPATPARAPGLPQVLIDKLAAEARQSPPQLGSVEAFQRGLVFAMDVSEAENMAPAADVVECDDLRPVVLADVWRVLVQARDDGSDESLAERFQGEELLTIAQDDSYNYRFFRFIGTPAPSDLCEAFKRVLGKYFSPPRYVWLRGAFIDMSSVPEVIVDGQRIYASSAGSGTLFANDPAIATGISPTRGEPVSKFRISMPNKAWVPAVVDPFLLDKLWSHHQDYVETWVGHPLAKWFRDAEPDPLPHKFEPAKVYIGEPVEGAELYVHFSNGRHRTRWLLSMQAAQVVVAFDPSQIALGREIGLVKDVLAIGDFFELGFELVAVD